MDYGEIVQRRRMVRRFLDRPVDAPSVDRILDVARRGPSAGFTQGFEFLVLEGPEQTERYWEATFPAAERHDPEWPGILPAPLIIVPLAHKQAYLDRYAERGWVDKAEGHWPVPYWLVDTSFAALLILLTVVDEGLGAVFFGIEGIDRFRHAFGVPEAYLPIGAVVIGHPAPDDRPERRQRRPLEQIVHRGSW